MKLNNMSYFTQDFFYWLLVIAFLLVKLLSFSVSTLYDRRSSSSLFILFYFIFFKKQIEDLLSLKIYVYLFIIYI